MREFELDRPVDAVSVKANNPSGNRARALVTLIPFVHIPVVYNAVAAVVDVVSIGYYHWIRVYQYRLQVIYS
ncbi:hypothetical protein [Ammonifex thiophilus]|uniref:hypothetical protein n=1 Tax=Ammonifex thiophilus TaxID=444093 RepID=UPI00106BDD5C|nr:hypothetical protein [Ammonifex thiophilus]